MQRAIQRSRERSLRTAFRATAAFSLLLFAGALSAQDTETRRGPTIVTIGSGGMRTYLGGQWGSLHFTLENPLNEPAEVLVATFFDDEKTLQFGRRLTLPPRSRQRSSHPIRLPVGLAAEERTFSFHTLLLRHVDGKEVLVRTTAGQLQYDGTLERVVEPPLLGIISEPFASVEGATDWLFELSRAVRPFTHAARRIVPINDQALPVTPEGLAAFDSLIVADNRLARDQAALAALRRWLFGGGRLWIMLDQVEESILEHLLGDEFRGAVIDRTELTTVRIDAGHSGIASDPTVRNFDDPVEFVRVLLPEFDAGEVIHAVDGWPAAYTRSCGEGRLLITMLGARGWIRARTSTDKLPEGTLQQYVGTEPLSVLSAVVLEPRRPPLLPPGALESQVQEQVGYSIPSRWLVVGLLVGFGVLLAVFGWFLARRERLEWLATFGPAMALIVTVCFLLIGQQQRRSAPPSVATVQFVQIAPGTDDVRVEGLAGLFSPEPGTATLSGTRGGWLIPDMAGQEGQTRRMIWTDFDQWQWENLPQGAGLRVASFVEAGEVTRRTEATATFDSHGLRGRLVVDPESEPTDAVLATRNGLIGVDLGRNGEFTARADRVFAPKQFVAADLLTDEQNRRREVLELLLANPRRLDFPDTPLLLFWTKPWDTGFRFDETHQRYGTALVAAPVRWERPPGGTEISLPSPLLPYREAIGPDGALLAGLYNHRRREWNEKSLPSSTWLRFQIPPVLLPAVITSGGVTAQVTGPIGRLEIAGQRDGQPVSLKAWMDPVGALSVDLSRLDLLPITPDGGVLLRVSGGDPDRPELSETREGSAIKSHYWRIESLQLNLKLKTLVTEGAPVADGGGVRG